MLRAGVADALFGRVLVAPLLAPHVHTPHCEPACSLRFALHVHSATCNHARAPRRHVGAAAKRGALEAALAAGGSTEEANAVRLLHVGHLGVLVNERHPKQSSRWTALHTVAGDGNVEAAQLLVAAGANVMAKLTVRSCVLWASTIVPPPVYSRFFVLCRMARRPCLWRPSRAALSSCLCSLLILLWIPSLETM